jgi:hypothetical protein
MGLGAGFTSTVLLALALMVRFRGGITSTVLLSLTLMVRLGVAGVKVGPVSVIILLFGLYLAGVVLLALALVVRFRGSVTSAVLLSLARVMGSAGLKVELVFLLVVNNVALVLLALTLVVGFGLGFTSVILLSLTLVMRFRVTSVEIGPVGIVVLLLVNLASIVLLALALVMGFRVTSVKVCPVSIVVFLIFQVDLASVVLLALAFMVAGLDLNRALVLFALALVMRLTSLKVTCGESSNKVRSLDWAASLVLVSNSLDHLDSMNNLLPCAQRRHSSNPVAPHRRRWRRQVPKERELKTS